MSSPPLVEELTPAPDVADTLARFAQLPGVLLLESSLQRLPLGRYSFLTADPFRWLEGVAGWDKRSAVPALRGKNAGTAPACPSLQDSLELSPLIDQTILVQSGHTSVGSLTTSAPGDNERDPLQQIKQLAAGFSADALPDLPPFQGGVAGLLGYELGHVWERLPATRYDDFGLPPLAVGFYDWVIAWDHQRQRAWIISQGFPETTEPQRSRRAAERLQQVKNRLAAEPPPVAAPPVPRELTLPTFPLPQLPELRSNFSRERYLEAVQRVIEYIYAGDIFQANLSQQLFHPLRESPLSLYRRLRRCNPAPFAGYFAHDDWAVLSSSPERFLQLQQREVSTRPIKGTRQRRSVPEADLFTREELRLSEKDQAENVMIVDLLRNDLSRVCQPGSLRVPQLCTVETYETVQHLVSEVRGRLRDGMTAWELLAATFPGGSITGAPKVRAMEIITELEQAARGPYCGSLFYCGFNGDLDSNILIRTITCRHGWTRFPAGGGIVADSRPVSEYEETLHKAAGMLRALGE